MNQVGFLSTHGVLCNCCCLMCEVWVGTDGRGRFIAFDGMPHRCNNDQRTRYWEMPNEACG